MYAQQYGGGAAAQASYDAALLFLKQLNTKELQDLVDDTTRLNQMVDDLDLIKNHELEKETQLTTNKSLAEYNLSREPVLIESRQQLADTYEQAAIAQREFESSKTKLDALSPNTSLDTTLALLQTEAAKCDEESEACAESFLSRQIDSDEFLRTFTQLRTLAHVRRVKVDKMSEIVREQERARSTAAAAQVAASRPAPVPAYNGMGGNFWGPPSSTPYPINPAGFPMINTAVYQ